MTDEEAAALGADAEAAHAYYEAWAAGRASSSGPPRTTPQAAAPAELTLLDIVTVGRGGEPAKVRVTTSRLCISTTGGTSAWKAFLGAATLGLSTAVTGINAGVGGDLDIPIGAVGAALITKTGMAYSTVKLVVAGDAIEFGLATIACNAVIGAINAAVSGGDRASIAAEAWQMHQSGRAKQWPSEGQLRKYLRTRQISQQRFERDIAISRTLRSLVPI